MKGGFKFLFVAVVLLAWAAGVPASAQVLKLSYDQGVVSLEPGRASVASILESLADLAKVEIYITEPFKDYSKDLEFKGVPLEWALGKLLKDYNYAVIYNHSTAEPFRCFAYTDADAFSPVGQGRAGSGTTGKKQWKSPGKTDGDRQVNGAFPGQGNQKSGKGGQRFGSKSSPDIRSKTGATGALNPSENAVAHNGDASLENSESDDSAYDTDSSLGSAESGSTSSISSGTSQNSTGSGDSSTTAQALEDASTQTAYINSSDESGDTSDTGIAESDTSDSEDSDSSSFDDSGSETGSDEAVDLADETQTQTAETDAIASKIAKLEYQIEKLEEDISSGRAEKFWNLWTSKKEAKYVYSHVDDLAVKKAKLAELKGE